MGDWRTVRWAALAVPCLLLFVAAACAPSPDPTTPGGAFAFESVDVVPMDRDTVLRGRTVLVEDGHSLEQEMHP